MSKIYEERQAAQGLRIKYRDAARAQLIERFGEHCAVNEHANVNESLDGDGAFVECVVWVPKEAIK